MITRVFSILIKQIFIFLGVFTSFHAWAAKDLSKSGEILTLEMAIKKSLSANWDIQQSRNVLRSSKITYDNAFDLMFLPRVNLYANVSSSHTLATLPGSDAASKGAAVSPELLSSQGLTAGNYAFSKGYPTTAVGLQLAQYTIFNFFRDHLAYEKARLTWERDQQRLTEAERNLRFRVISSYFRSKTQQDKLDAAKRSLDISEAILELVRSNQALGRAKDTDVNSSTVDYLNAKNQYNEVERTLQSERWRLNLLMGESVDRQYVLKSDLEYTPLQITFGDAYQLYLDRAPQARDANLSFKSSELDLSLAEKNRLPLPTISLNALGVEYGNRYWGDTRSVYTSPADYSGNIDIVASLNFTIPLYGPGGFLGKRNIEVARISRDNSELALQKLLNQSKIDIQTSIITVKQQEQTIALTRESITNSSKLLEILFSNFSRSGANRLELRDAINQARLIEFSYRDAILQHLDSKLGLAELIGVDHLPGEFF